MGNTWPVEDAGTVGEQGVERERRTPVRARTALQALGFREQMEQFGSSLMGLEPRDRRPVFELARWIAANWIGNHGPSHRSLVVEVTPSETSLCALVFSDPELDDQQFWRDLVEGAPPQLINSWAHDRRGSFGVSFELVRPER